MKGSVVPISTLRHNMFDDGMMFYQGMQRIGKDSSN